MKSSNPSNLYQANQALTDNVKNVVLLLHDALLRDLRVCEKLILQGDLQGAEKKMKKSRKIILEICGFFRKETYSQVIENLNKLYGFCFEKLELKVLQENPQILQDLRMVLQTLKEGWQGMAQEPKSTSRKQFKNIVC